VTGFFPLLKGRNRVSLLEIEDLRIKGSKCLVGRLGDAKKINKEAFKLVLTRIWHTRGHLFFKEIQDNLWLFEFSDEEDQWRVLEGRPWSYDRTLLILNVFDSKIPPSQMVFDSSPIWIQIHDMPMGCMNRAVARKIGESLGRVEEVAIAEDDVGVGKKLKNPCGYRSLPTFRAGEHTINDGKLVLGSFQIWKTAIFLLQMWQKPSLPEGLPWEDSYEEKHTEGAPAWGSWLCADDLAWGPKFVEGQRGTWSPSPVDREAQGET
jgi:hypothetical protein